MFAPISVPETQPATELVDGYLVQKKGGELRHQHEFTAPGHCFALLVPDVAFQSAETLVKLGPEGSEAPACAPQVAVEILSVGEPGSPLAWGIGAYLAAGTSLSIHRGGPSLRMLPMG
jgi:hypothetical protein